MQKLSAIWFWLTHWPGFWAWYNGHIVKGFYKAESWLVNAVAVLIGIVPDLINLLISNWSMVDGLPTLSVEHKLYMFAAANVMAMILRARKQKNMPQNTVPVAVVPVPDTVKLESSHGQTVDVATEVVNIERTKADPGPTL